MKDRSTTENPRKDTNDKKPYQGLEIGLIHSSNLANPKDATSSLIFRCVTYRFGDLAAISKAIVRVADPEFYGWYASPNTK